MSMRDITKTIQEHIGTDVDGIYGRNTALAVIEKLDFSTEELTKIIQQKVGTLPDGIYGPDTGKGLLQSLGLEIPNVTSNNTLPAIAKGNYSEVYKASPNISSTRIVPEGVVLHHSSGSYEGSVSWVLQDDSNVSYHCIIDKDGSRTVFADDTRRCWHAGVSNFNGRDYCNGFLLGLAFSGDTNTRELTEDEIASAVEWLLPRFERWGWPKDLSTVTTHRNISPDRRDDVDIRAEKAIIKALKETLL